MNLEDNISLSQQIGVAQPQRRQMVGEAVTGTREHVGHNIETYADARTGRHKLRKQVCVYINKDISSLLPMSLLVLLIQVLTTCSQRKPKIEGTLQVISRASHLYNPGSIPRIHLSISICLQS